MKPSFVVLSFLCCAAGLAAWASFGTADDEWRKLIQENSTRITGRPVLSIAHAGGAINGAHYTNSVDALNASYKSGYRVAEIDFMRTTDNRIVCIHDWRAGRLSFEQFEASKNSSTNFLMKYNNCSLESLGEFLKTHPDMSLVTDTKEVNSTSIVGEITTRLHNDFGIPVSRIIPQGYNLDEVIAYKKLGFERVIYTLYKVRGDRKIDQACKLPGVAITYPADWLLRANDKGELEQFLSMFPDHCPQFVHPVSSMNVLQKLLSLSLGIQGVYTTVPPQ